MTSAIRRNNPAFLDSKIHHNNLLNNILAKIEANVAGVDDALMLDGEGFIAETNATNVFAVRSILVTPTAVACLPGLTGNWCWNWRTGEHSRGRTPREPDGILHRG